MNQKYRPVLSAEEIRYLLSRCKEDKLLGATCISCIHKLSVYQTKIDNAGIVPAYATLPKSSLLERLGEEEPSSTNPHGLPKEELWAQSYEKYRTSPSSCTLVEIQEAKEHMYLSGLMTDAELEEFEANEY